MNEEDRLAALMWLEYAAEGDNMCMAATGHTLNDCIWIAHSFVQGPVTEYYQEAKELHAKHMADLAIENAQHMARGKPPKTEAA